MELRHLRYLVAVAEEQSFLRAAERLRVAQSALSRQIQDLEREVGIKLFDRAPRGVRMTPGGEAFVREARSILANADRAVRSARHAQADAGMLLRLGHEALGAQAPTVLQLIADFRQAYPESEVEIHHLDEVEQRSALADGAIDIVATYIAEPPESGFSFLPLSDCPCDGALLPADHPLAKQDRFHLHELADLTYLSPSTHHWPRLCRAIFKAMAERGLDITCTRAMSSDTHTGILEVAVGAGWVLANEAYEKIYRAITPAIVFRRFVEPPIPFQFVLMWHDQTTSRWVHPISEIARKRSTISLVA